MSETQVQERHNALLRSLDPKQAAEYHMEVLRQQGAVGLQISLIPGRNYGVRALKDFKEGDVVFTEKPLICQQHEASKDCAICCSHCLGFLGSLELQAAWILRRSELPRELIEGLQTGQIRLPLNNAARLPAPVACRGRCNELYCSQKCADRDWQLHHSLLCSGDEAPAASIAGRQEALEVFHHHAEDTNDIFILASKAMAFVMLQASSIAAETGLSRAEATLRAFKPFQAAWKGIWWETIAVPPDIDAEDTQAVQEFRAELRDLASESLGLLRQALDLEEDSALLDLTVYGSIIGMFELNNMALSIPNPLEAAVHRQGENSTNSTKAEDNPDLIMDLLAEELEETEVTCEGTGFFCLHSLINHSCQPNLKQQEQILSQSRDNNVEFVAVTSIHPGDELTLNYVSDETDFEERKNALKDYGFECRCPLCLEGH